MNAADGIAWRCRAGLNVFWPHGGPVHGADGAYPADPYSIGRAGAWRDHLPQAIIARDLALGCDHYRHQPSPAPFLEAAGDRDRLAGYHRAMDEIVDDTLAVGMGVMWAPFLAQPNIDPLDPLDGVGEAGFERYATYLAATAARYASRDPRLFALAVMNEPPDPATFAHDWPEMQRELYRRVRAVAPNMTLALTSANYASLYLLSGADYAGSIDVASGLDTDGFDDNVLWEFHPMLPAPLVLHGAPYHERYRYVRDLSYPPTASNREATMIATSAAINSAAGLTSPQKMALLGRGGLIEELGFFFDLPQDRAWFGRQLDHVISWAEARGIARAALYAGEVGFTRANAEFVSGNDSDSVARATRDASIEIAKRGFRVAWDHLDTPDYGITDGIGVNIGDHRPEMLAAIDFAGFRRDARPRGVHWPRTTTLQASQSHNALTVTPDQARPPSGSC